MKKRLKRLNDKNDEKRLKTTLADKCERRSSIATIRQKLEHARQGKTIKLDQRTANPFSISIQPDPLYGTRA